MLLIAKIICFSSILALLHTYVFYPRILQILSYKNNKNAKVNEIESWPAVSVVMSLYNEEKVIAEKLDCLLNLDYPREKLRIYIGSDCSSDRTNTIVSQFATKHPSIIFFPFKNRRGKPGVVNELVAIAKRERNTDPNHILLLSDANVMLEITTLKKLVRHFQNPEIALVDSNMISLGLENQGISRSENQYVNSEVQLKNREGLLWGKMIGPFGGCYAMRASHFYPVPANFLVDDFFIAMKVLEKGALAINDLEARCFEAVSHEISEEYRRKSRISAGNFQNLKTFRHLLWPPFNTLAFAFLSHKVLRWLGPFFIIFASISSAYLATKIQGIYLFIFVLIITILIIIPILDFIFKRLNLNILLFRNVRYFVSMNIALLEGFFKYIKGIKTNVWQPPKRL